MKQKQKQTARTEALDDRLKVAWVLLGSVTYTVTGLDCRKTSQDTLRLVIESHSDCTREASTMGKLSRERGIITGEG